MKICVLGCGAYGLALSIVLTENKNEVVAWSPIEDEVRQLTENKTSKKLPDVVLSSDIKFTTDLEKAINGSALVLIAVPTAFVRSALESSKEYIKNKPICIACLFVADIVSEVLNTDNIAVISGPSFAIDVANKVPVGLTLASQNKETSDLIIKAFSNDHFKLNVCEDIIGIEICGAIKNVFAIASGMLKGMCLPESTSALFLTESINDIKELIIGLGGSKDTVLNFAGIGDFILTATSEKSRNYSFGYLIGSGASREKINEYIKNTTIEGLYTLKSIKDLINNKNIDMPIINLIWEIIYGNKDPQNLVDFLIKKS